MDVSDLFIEKPHNPKDPRYRQALYPANKLRATVAAFTANPHVELVLCAPSNFHPEWSPEPLHLVGVMAHGETRSRAHEYHSVLLNSWETASPKNPLQKTAYHRMGIYHRDASNHNTLIGSYVISGSTKTDIFTPFILHGQAYALYRRIHRSLCLISLPDCREIATMTSKVLYPNGGRVSEVYIPHHAMTGQSVGHAFLRCHIRGCDNDILYHLDISRAGQGHLKVLDRLGDDWEYASRRTEHMIFLSEHHALRDMIHLRDMDDITVDKDPDYTVEVCIPQTFMLPRIGKTDPATKPNPTKPIAEPSGC